MVVMVMMMMTYLSLESNTVSCVMSKSVFLSLFLCDDGGDGDNEEDHEDDYDHEDDSNNNNDDGDDK